MANKTDRDADIIRIVQIMPADPPKRLRYLIAFPHLNIAI
jgi:hypothetical protein